MRDTGSLLPASGGHGELLLSSFSTLLVLCVLVWLVVRVAIGWLRRGRRLGTRGGPIQEIQRLPLDPRHALHLVRVGERLLLLATGERGVQMLAEVASDAVAITDGSPDPRSFQELLSAAMARLAGRARSDAPRSRSGIPAEAPGAARGEELA